MGSESTAEGAGCQPQVSPRGAAHPPPREPLPHEAENLGRMQDTRLPGLQEARNIWKMHGSGLPGQMTDTG